ncbi:MULTISPECIES: hypothetical protein [Azotobacter]|uniref:hypothetical protein n=1 Tax=Azotobacter TaxID=352 RepID=UPI001650B0A1|nr:hypothetical protein [Azotobacter vinelandii]
MSAPVQSISQRLAALGASGAFATRFAIEADPQLHVEGVGSVPLPVTIHTAHRLCAPAVRGGAAGASWLQGPDAARSARARYLGDPGQPCPLRFSEMAIRA